MIAQCTLRWAHIAEQKYADMLGGTRGKVVGGGESDCEAAAWKVRKDFQQVLHDDACLRKMIR